MLFLPVQSPVASHAMKNLRETIHENELLNALAEHVRSSVRYFFNSQECWQFLEKNL